MGGRRWEECHRPWWVVLTSIIVSQCTTIEIFETQTWRRLGEPPGLLLPTSAASLAKGVIVCSTIALAIIIQPAVERFKHLHFTLLPMVIRLIP